MTLCRSGRHAYPGHGRCRKCKQLAQRRWVVRNYARWRAGIEKSRLLRREQIRTYRRNYYWTHRDEACAYDREYHRAHRESENARTAARRRWGTYDWWLGVVA